MSEEINNVGGRKDNEDACDVKIGNIAIQIKDPYNRTRFERMREMIDSIAATSSKKGVITGLVDSNDRRIAKIRAELRSLKFEQHYYRNELKKLDARDFEDNGDGKDV